MFRGGSYLPGNVFRGGSYLPGNVSWRDHIYPEMCSGADHIYPEMCSGADHIYPEMCPGGIISTRKCVLEGSYLPGNVFPSPPLPPPPEPSQVFLQFTINHHLPLIWATLGVEYLTWQDPGGGVSQLFIPDIDGF